MKLLIKKGRVVDPSQNLDAVKDILIEDGRVKEVGDNLKDASAEVFDAKGLVVMPGIVDLHVHLREPGLEAKEDVISGTRAAAAGGVTTVACMANTRPVIDSSILVSGLKERIAREALVNVEVIGAVTKELKGEELAEMGDMTFAGAMAFSDDGAYVHDSRLFKSALEYAAIFDKTIIVHAEEPALAKHGFMNEGFVSTELGIPGNPTVAEDIATARDIMLAEYTGARLHVAHVTTKGAVELIRQAKRRGVRVSGEAAVHHLTLTDEVARGFNVAARVAPPLRSMEHMEAVRAGVKDGTLEAIVTDHAPHAFEEKDVEFRYAPCGFTGLETSLGVVLTDLYHGGVLTLNEIALRMSTAPAELFALDAGTLKPGAKADVTIFDLDKEWTVDSAKFYTRGKLTPFEGKKLKGKAVATIVAGEIVMKDGVVNE